MFQQLRELFFLLSSEQKKRFYWQQILVIFMAFSEVVGIASIGPFMALVGDISLLEKNSFFNSAYKLSGLQNPNDFLFTAGVAVLLLLGIASIVSMVATWRLSLFAFKIGTEIADRLYRYYLTRNWLFHSDGSSAQLTKQISTEAVRITAQVILPLMQMNARIVLAVFISVVMIVYNPMIALIGVVLFLSAYIFLFKIVRSHLSKNGFHVSAMSTKRYRLMNEGFGGVRDILLMGRGKHFIHSFEETGKALAKASGVNNALTYVPRYLMELLAFSAMIGLILYLIKNSQGDLGKVLPVLAVYALAGFKLLPALQSVYAGLSEIRGNISAFEAIKKDLIDSKNMVAEFDDSQSSNHHQLVPLKEISLKNINFFYPGKTKPTLENLTLKIPANKFIGIVGASGSGKSTLIDLLLGLIQPKSGEIRIDENLITNQNIRFWQNGIGFVSQNIFLSEGTVAENIAFGIAEENINYQQIAHVIQLAKLEELVKELPLGLKTTIGERGFQISGGQRQRIGIARALYGDAQVLVFDEATSALDGITERLIMDAIHSFGGKKTVIMIAHRLKTIENCDFVFHLENGQLRSSGTYQELLVTDPLFKEMAKHA